MSNVDDENIRTDNIRQNIEKLRARLIRSLFHGKRELFRPSMKTLIWQHTKAMEQGIPSGLENLTET